MGSLAAEFPFSCCQCQLPSTSNFTSSRNGSSRCSAVWLRRGRVEANRRLVGLSTWRGGMPLAQRGQWGNDWSGDCRGERGIRGGKLGLATRVVAVYSVAFGQKGAPKPSSLPLEQITGETHFDQVLGEAMERNQPIIIDWLAEWCRKCIYLKPKLEKLAAEYHPQIKFYYVDVNKVPQTLVKRAQVTKMPTIQLWKNGDNVAEVIGGHQAWLVLDEVREMISLKK